MLLSLIYGRDRLSGKVVHDVRHQHNDQAYIGNTILRRPEDVKSREYSGTDRASKVEQLKIMLNVVKVRIGSRWLACKCMVRKEAKVPKHQRETWESSESFRSHLKAERLCPRVFYFCSFARDDEDLLRVRGTGYQHQASICVRFI